jgi:hypothetical protein
MSAWPSTLPAALIASYSVKPDVGFIRTDMDVGAARQRRRYTAQPSRIPVSWIFTAAQMAAFKTFYETTLDVGTGWFTMTINAGAGQVTKDCRFVESYEAKPLSATQWTVSGNIEVRDA